LSGAEVAVSAPVSCFPKSDEERGPASRYSPRRYVRGSEAKWSALSRAQHRGVRGLLGGTEQSLNARRADQGQIYPSFPFSPVSFPYATWSALFVQ
jgi:hypothetical protein